MAAAPVTCVYQVYEDARLAATGRLVLDSLPRVGDEVTLNGRAHRVRSVEFAGGEHVLQLHPA